MIGSNLNKNLGELWKTLVYTFVGFLPYKNAKEKYDSLTIFLVIGGIITFIINMSGLVNWY